MARDFEAIVDRVAQRIAHGSILLSERIRGGRRRQISLGPYRSAVGPKEYAFCVLPAMPGAVDCRHARNPKNAAREFVRFVGKEEARNALVREAQKRG